MKLKPISWYFNYPTFELMVGPAGYNNHPKGTYELESANPAANSYLVIHNLGVNQPNRYYLGKHHAEYIVQKYKLPINGQNLEIPNVAIEG